MSEIEKQKEIALKTIFDKLSHQKVNPDNTQDILTVEEIAAAIENNMIEPNCVHYNQEFKTSLLHAAVRAKNYEVVEYLLSIEDINVNHQSSSGDTALHQAAYDDAESLVLKLMSKGAKLNILNNKANKGETPLENALYNRKATQSPNKQLANKIVGKLIDNILASQSGIENISNPIKVINDRQVEFSLPAGCPLLLELQNKLGNSMSQITITIEQLQDFLIEQQYILEQDRKFINIDAIGSSSYSVVSGFLGALIDRPMSYTQWLKEKYGVIYCGERGEKNDNKSTSILYGFDDKDSKGINRRQYFCQQFSGKSLVPCYKTDFQGNPAVVLSDELNFSYNDILYEQYKKEMSKVRKADLQKCSIEQAQLLLAQKKANIQRIQDIKYTISRYDDIKTVSSGRFMTGQQGSRLDEFNAVVAEAKEGMYFYKSIASYKLSLEAFIAAHLDMLSEQQIISLNFASDTLMGKGKDAASSGLKADSNFVDFLWQNQNILLQTDSYKPKEQLINIITQDAKDLLYGRDRRLVIDEKIKPSYLTTEGGMQLITGTTPPVNGTEETFRKIPRFLPPGDQTDEIILQTGGSSSHSTMVRIWKMPVKNGDKTYYRFFRTEYNTGAGCHIPNQANNTCQGTYTTEISGKYFNNEGKHQVLPDPEIYHQIMIQQLEKLISAERTILMYRAPTVGPQNEAAAKDQEEKNKWEQEREKIRTNGLIPHYNQYGSLVGREHYRPEYSSTAIMQFSGNCTLKSQRQLVEDVLTRRGNLSPEEARTLVQLHFGWAQGHDKKKTILSLSDKEQQISQEIKELEKIIAVKRAQSKKEADRVNLSDSLQETGDASLSKAFDSLQEKEKYFHDKRAPNKVLESNNIPALLKRAPAYHYNPQQMRDQLVKDANDTQVIIDSSVNQLIKDFLFNKIQHGSKEEKQVYKELFGEQIQNINRAEEISEENIKQFIDRLLTKRPLVFYLPQDYTVVAKEAPKIPLNRDIPTNDYISYDEMLISANIGVSSPTFFINKGGRYNMGDPIDDTKKFVNRGVYIGLVGPRFEKFGSPGKMEAKHMFITADQNTAENGYGKEPDIAAARELVSWKQFYGLQDNFPSWEEVSKQGEGHSANYLYIKEHKNQGNSIPAGYLNVAVYKARLRKVIEPFLMEANQRAEEAGTKAYVHAVGLGLGAWVLDEPNQNKLTLEVYKEILEQYNFANIADIDFSYINKDSSVDIELAANVQNINVHFTKNDPADNLTKLQGSPEKLLVAAYAWDGGSYPGNEYWLGYSAYAKSGDPAAAACSMITTLQNPEINPEFTKRIVDNYKLKHAADVEAAEKVAEDIARKALDKLAIAGHLEEASKEAFERQALLATEETARKAVEVAKKAEGKATVAKSNAVNETTTTATLSSTNLSSPYSGSKVDKEGLKYYSAKSKEFFENQIKDTTYMQVDRPNHDNDYIVGELRTNVTADAVDKTNGDLIAVIKYGSIECSKIENKDNLVDAQYEAFIAFLKMESALAGENPITIKINYFSPKELEGFFSKLNKLKSKLSNIILELPSSPEKCVYGDNQQYDLQEHKKAILSVEKYNNKEGSFSESPRGIDDISNSDLPKHSHVNKH